MKVRLVPTLLIAAAGLLPSLSALAADCKAVHSQLGFQESVALTRCNWNERAFIVKQKYFDSCVSTISSLAQDYTSANICFNKEVALRVAAQPQIGKCIAEGSDKLAKYFWFQEDFVMEKQQSVSLGGFTDTFWSLLFGGGPREGTQPSATFFQARILKACEAAAKGTPLALSLPLAAVEPVAKVIGQTHIHTLTVPRGQKGFLGGFSDLIADEQTLTAVSDDLEYPSLSFIDWQWNPDGKTIAFQYKSTQPILKNVIPKIDFEGMVLLPNGEYLLSTELAALLSGIVIPYPEQFLLRVGKDGKYKGSEKLRRELRPYVKSIEIPCAVAPEAGDEYGDSPAVKPAPVTTPGRTTATAKPCTQVVRASGFRHNKGIEALSLDETGKNIMYLPEEPPDLPLLANGKVAREGFSPLTVQALRSGVVLASYDYPMSLDKDNGVVALRHFSGNRYISLERNFDPKVGEAGVRIYMFDLPQPGQVIKKTLIVDLADLKSEMPSGFDNIDNFEGLAIGPRAANGNPVLFLVSDNNFSHKQRSAIFALEISKEVLQ